MFQPSLRFPSPPSFFVFHLLLRILSFLSLSLSSCHSSSFFFCHPSATIEAIEAIETVKDPEGKITLISLWAPCLWGHRSPVPTMHLALLTPSALRTKAWNHFMLGPPHKTHKNTHTSLFPPPGNITLSLPHTQTQTHFFLTSSPQDMVP